MLSTELTASSSIPARGADAAVRITHRRQIACIMQQQRRIMSTATMGEYSQLGWRPACGFDRSPVSLVVESVGIWHGAGWRL